MLTSRGLGAVLGDLASMGFDARWGVLGAADVGAPHQRDRIWIKGVLADTKRKGLEGHWDERGTTKTSGQWPPNDFRKGGWWGIEPNVGRVANGVAARVDRLKAIGNGQDSRVAAFAFNTLTRGLI
jgi:DNA (cytosine-5)-methyltransferase 1